MFHHELILVHPRFHMFLPHLGIFVSKDEHGIFFPGDKGVVGQLNGSLGPDNGVGLL